MDEENSSYISDVAAETVSGQFSDVTIEHTSGGNVVARAQRYGRWYILKGLNDTSRDQAMPRQMLRKEFDILIRMQHPNVVQTLGMEHVEGLGTCIVMEYVDGITLKEWLQTKTKTKKGAKDADAVRILDELLHAVAYIHSLGIAHRDLKPQNIILTRQGLHVKLIDFGLADTDDYAVLKQPAGTASYMSPEQMAMQIPDIRNDIYSIGVVMRQMPLPRYYKQVGEHCLLPIDERYQSVAEMEDDIARQGTRTKRLMRWSAAVVLGVWLTVVGLLVWRVQSLDNELNRVTYAKGEAIEALHAEMERTQLNQHTDTLTCWEYRWKDFMQRMMAVNQFCYDYTDRLDDRFTDNDRDRIREAMLNEWQLWQQHICVLSTAEVAAKRRKVQRAKSGME
jgi:serine/threonine protein kinase